MAKEVLSLEQQIEARKEEAKNKQINVKASTIARYLGHVDNSYKDGTDETVCTFESKDKTMKIVDTNGTINGSDGMTGFFSTVITYKGNVVYKSGGGDLYAYLPGRWERKFDTLHEEALIAEKKFHEEQKLKRENQKKESDDVKRRKWGL